MPYSYWLNGGDTPEVLKEAKLVIEDLLRDITKAIDANHREGFEFCLINRKLTYANKLLSGATDNEIIEYRDFISSINPRRLSNG